MLQRQGLCRRTTGDRPSDDAAAGADRKCRDVVELVAGLLAGSVALLADSLDMLGDALVYGFSLYVVGRGPVWRVRAAVAKAAAMGLFGAFVFVQVVYKLLYPQLPTFGTMGVVGALALAVNGVCFVLLWRHRADDINMRSVWLCSRNDLIANVAVLLAAAAVWVSVSPWPDIAVGALICAVFFRSGFLVAREARAPVAPRSNQARRWSWPSADFAASCRQMISERKRFNFRGKGRCGKSAGATTSGSRCNLRVRAMRDSLSGHAVTAYRRSRRFINLHGR